MIGNPCFRTFSQLFDPKTGFFDSKTGFFLTQKQIFLTQEQEIISKLFSQNFSEFEKTGYFQNISELQKPNYSKTRESEKLGKFRLMQGLSIQ